MDNINCNNLANNVLRHEKKNDYKAQFSKGKGLPRRMSGITDIKNIKLTTYLYSTCWILENHDLHGKYIKEICSLCLEQTAFKWIENDFNKYTQKKRNETITGFSYQFLFTLYRDTFRRELDQPGFIIGRHLVIIRYTDKTLLMADSEW